MSINSSVKKCLSLLLVFLMSFTLFACNNTQEQVATEATTTAVPLEKIAVLSMKLDESGQKAYDGFFSALADNGYAEGENFIWIGNACDAEEELSGAAKAIVSEKPDLIYAIGVDAAIAVKAETSDIPVVFSCVADPVGTGLVKLCEKPEANITGVCDYPPVFEQIVLMTKLCPNITKIGCLYNGADEDSIFTSNLARGEAQALDIKFTMYPCLTENAFYDDLETALEKCDALYLPDDALVNSTLKTTLKKAKEAGIPVFAESTALVESGCLATCISDYEHIGYTAGELGAILLRGLKPVSSVPVEYASDCTPVINSKVLKSYKITLSDEIKKDALIINAS